MDAHVTLEHNPSLEMGLAVLLAAQILSSYMGIYVQDTYAQYGNHWRENLFYSHLFSIPLFMPLQPTLSAQCMRLQMSSAIALPPSMAAQMPSPALALMSKVPRAVMHLAINSITQLVCITGVNLLGARSSAVTVTIVLNVRKLVSFMLSIWLFGNKMSGLMLVGATLVFGSGALYGWETSVRLKRKQAQETKKPSRNVNGTVAGEKKEL